MTKIEIAELYATCWHEHQIRKYTGEPYVEHPKRVMKILQGMGMTDENVLVAALLHDVVEDCSVPISTIRDTFGQEVGEMVSALTEPAAVDQMGVKLSRAQRKAAYRDQLAAASSDVQTIKCVDIIDNAGSIVTHDPNFARVWLQEKALELECMEKANEILLATAKGIVFTMIEHLKDKNDKECMAVPT